MWKRRIRQTLGVLLAAGMLVINALPQSQALRKLPDTVYLHQGENAKVDFLFPLKVSFEGETASVLHSEDETLEEKGMTFSENIIRSNDVGSGTISFSLLGVPIKSVQLEVSEEKVLVPGGTPVGVTMTTKGVYVVQRVEVTDAAGNVSDPAAVADIRSGDCVLSIDDTPLQSMNDLVSYMAGSDGSPVDLEILRGERLFDVSVTPAKDEQGVWRLGLWVRDSTAGVGTMTYYDPVERSFGALGHAITDADTLEVLPLGNGILYPAQIREVVRGQRGKPGELRGMFNIGETGIGTLDKNTELGLFGTLDQNYKNALYPEGLPVASPSQVQVGSASILSTVGDSGVQEYACRIVKVNPQAGPAQRGMVIEITDERLLETTGGIVQGMSGSPIIQNEHIVGAVTHVYVSDPTRGYGVYLQWMLEEAAA